MTPTRLRECREIIGWSQNDLALRLGRPRGTIQQWEEGRVQIPTDVGEWLHSIARYVDLNPPPTRSPKHRK